MTTLLPTSQPTGVETYEDMFKEITRKLYGDESAHGLYPHNTQVAQLAQLAPGAPTAPPDGGERSFTTLTQIGYETTTVGSGHQPSSSAAQQLQQQQQQQQEHITTAFGLAALMQNGFPPPGAILNPVNFPNASKPPTNISIPSTDDRWQSQQASEESWNGGKHVSPSGTSTSHSKSYKKPKTEPQDVKPLAGLNIPSTVDRANKRSSYGSATSPAGTNVIKRYSCTSCPYTTDRRDLFTRHENIHKDEKPFQCYACLKPFNRADHVKKHFLRMHREMEYDIAKTRRHPPGGSSGTKSSYYGSHTQTTNLGSSTGSTTAAMTLAQMQLNIPTGSFSTAPSLVVPSHTLESSSGGTNHNGSHPNQLLQIQNHPQADFKTQQQQSHNHLHSSQLSVSIKQEKSSGFGSAATSSFNTSANSSGSSVDEKPLLKKIKGEKKFACTYCPWAGADNWGLKRHLNTHTKPYVCLLCDYKAARSERLATHVLKVHNKKACSKCSFFAEDQAHLDAHLQEAHLLHMQAVGRNKASVTQDFRNAGGGYNGGDAGDKTNVPENVSISLASLFSSDQLSFLQLLATAAVAHQQMQLHTNQQQRKQQQQKPSKAAENHDVGAANGVRNGSTMVSSPPATFTQQQQQPRTASTSASANGTTSPYSTNDTTSAGVTVPFDLNYQQSQPLALDMGSSKKRRTTASSSDKENHVHRKRPNGAPQQCIGITASSFAHGGSAINGGGTIEKHITHNAGSKVGQHQNPHHHNNNNNSTSNKNINDIFDKMYKKAQNSFHTSKHQSINQQQQQNGLSAPPAHSLTTILRTAPPSAVEEDNQREASSRQDAPDQAEKFSLTEFLKNHTEVSISTVGCKGAVGPVTMDDPACNQETKETHSELDEFLLKQEYDRNPRKRYQPRRIENNETLPSFGDDPMAFVSVEMLDTYTGPNKPTEHEELEQEKAIDLKIEKRVPVKMEEKYGTVARLADIRDKHMIKLITNRRCCRICQRKGLLDHLDNSHYHTKVSLILHTLWRHGGSSMSQLQCRECSAFFNERYKLLLHQNLTKHTGMVRLKRPRSLAQQNSKSSTGSTGSTNRPKKGNGHTNKNPVGLRKANADGHRNVDVENVDGKRKRKRKARSRCFTAKRKNRYPPTVGPISG